MTETWHLHLTSRISPAVYDGDMTADIVSDVTAAGGVLTAEDLSKYQPKEYEGVLRDFGELALYGITVGLS